MSTPPNDLITRGRHHPPRLLVSVRSTTEALEAIAGGVEILDIKEPTNGSLGMATTDVIREITDVVQRQARPAPVSVALGELTDWTHQEDAALLPAAVTFAKVGLSGLQRQTDWQRSWLSFRHRCEERRQKSIRWVAVGYADVVEAKSPGLSEILQAAIETDCAGFLIDTYGKGTKSLLDHVPVAQLCEFAEECREAKIFLAIAGRLTIETLPEVRECRPDLYAIRSAACREGNRQDSVEASRVAAFRDAIHRIHQQVAPVTA